jgi:hypothetical protein
VRFLVYSYKGFECEFKDGWDRKEEGLDGMLLRDEFE